MLAQDGPQPVQLVVYPAQFADQRRAVGNGLSPLLLPVGPGGEQLLLLGARCGGGLEILPVDRGFLLPAHLRNLLFQLAQVRSRACPAFDRRQAMVQRVDPRESVLGQPGARRLPDPCSSWITCWRTRFRSAPSFTSTCAATPSPSRSRPSRMCSVPM